MSNSELNDDSNSSIETSRSLKSGYEGSLPDIKIIHDHDYDISDNINKDENEVIVLQTNFLNPISIQNLETIHEQT